MIQDIPSYVSIIFILTTILTLLLFYWVIKNASLDWVKKKSNVILLGIIIWLAIQAVLAIKNIYNTNTSSLPPKIMMMAVLPPLLVIIFLFISKKGKVFIDSLPLLHITYLNVVRIPVEIVLLWLSVYKAIPQLMTFEGRNFDVISGITAPFIVYLGFAKDKLGNTFILIWNFICLALLMNIVVNALLSAPTPFQKFAFEQPNIAILNFPFIWLPAFIVPVVLFGHLVSIRRLIKLVQRKQ